MEYRNQIQSSRPTLGEEEIKAISRVIRSGFLVRGSEVLQLEKEICEYIGVKYGFGCASATAALHLCLLSMDIHEGDEVIIPTYVCISVLNPVVQVGATPVLVDIENESYNVSPEDISNKITSKTKAIIVPHMFGESADLETILGFEIPVIEDLAQSLGARYNGKMLGSFGELSVLSFYATKVIASGYGGMILTSNSRYRLRFEDLIKNDKRERYNIFYSYPFDDLRAAMARVQLSKINYFIQRRKEIAAVYDSFFEFKGIARKRGKNRNEGIELKYLIELENSAKFIEDMESKGISCGRPVYRPIHHYLDLDTNLFPNSESAYERTVSIPLYPSLTDKQVSRVIDVVNKVL